MNEIFIGLGSNLGDREDNIRTALNLLEEKMNLVVVSSLYETEPMYVKDQPLFLNCVAKFETDLEPEEVLNYFHTVEKNRGRERSVRYGPRTIDLDILFYGGRIVDRNFLKIPHPLIQERLFVLVPLAEIAPEFVHPVYKLTVAELLKDLHSNENVRKVGEVD
jgi:2-amino-4-hydroxy-6-hydroxymethyldihydropteridine diphosphokinase